MAAGQVRIALGPRSRLIFDNTAPSKKQSHRIELVQCQQVRSPRNHIAMASLARTRLKEVARQTQKTVYQLKQQLPDDYISQQLKSPNTAFAQALSV